MIGLCPVYYETVTFVQAPYWNRSHVQEFRPWLVIKNIPAMQFWLTEDWIEFKRLLCFLRFDGISSLVSAIVSFPL